MEAFVLSYIAEFTYMGIFMFLMLTVFGFPFPEDAVLLAGGVVVSQGVIDLMPTLVISYIGVVTGDMLLYFIGRRYGRRIVNHRRFGKIITRRRLSRARVWFRRWGSQLVFFGRHLVGVRAQIFLCSGIFKLHPGRVLAYDSAAALIGVPLMIWLGYFFGHNLPYIREKVVSGHWALTIAAFTLTICWFGYSHYRKRSVPETSGTPSA